MVNATRFSSKREKCVIDAKFSIFPCGTIYLAQQQGEHGCGDQGTGQRGGGAGHFTPGTRIEKLKLAPLSIIQHLGNEVNRAKKKRKQFGGRAAGAWGN